MGIYDVCICVVYAVRAQVYVVVCVSADMNVLRHVGESQRTTFMGVGPCLPSSLKQDFLVVC